jgi:hypothetical protein
MFTICVPTFARRNYARAAGIQRAQRKVNTHCKISLCEHFLLSFG